MTANIIRKKAFELLHYACDHCDAELNYKGKLSDVTKFLKLENPDDLKKILLYLRDSKMLYMAEAKERDDELIISKIYYDAINWIADFRE